MSADMNHGGALGRAKMTSTQRIELLEHDRESQSRVLTALVESSKSFTPEQIAQLRAVMVDVLGDAGLRLDEAEHEDEAREDFRFLRRFRKAFDGASTQVGRSLLMALIGVVAVIISLGFWQWISHGSKGAGGG
jgi:hypothetical protein